MATYTGTADANGDFTVSFGGNNYTSAQKVTVTAEKDSAIKSIELFAPSAVTGGGLIDIRGSMTNFPQNITDVYINPEIGTTITQGAFAAANVYPGMWMRVAKSLHLPEGLVTIGVDGCRTWVAATSLSFPSTLRNIGATAFRDWIACKSLTLPEGIATLSGSEIFYGWIAATSLTLPSTLTTISGGGTFSNWSSLTQLTLPASLATFSDGNTFRDATSLSLLKCLRTSPPTISSSTFFGIPSGCVIQVPAASLNAYKTATYWSAYASQMVGV